MAATRIRRTLLALIVLIAIGAGPTVRVGVASPLHHAGIVVRHDDGRMAYGYIAFAEDDISGIDLLKRSGLDVVTISFGGLGEGVCSIDEHGCPSTDCRKRVCQGPKPDDPFWQYFRQVSLGDWQPVALGASSTRVRDGDVDGWSWTGTEPQLPALTMERIATLAGFSGDTIAPSGTPQPGVALVREGAIAADDEQGTLVYVAAVGLLAAAGGVIAIAMRRRRGKVIPT